MKWVETVCGTVKVTPSSDGLSVKFSVSEKCARCWNYDKGFTVDCKFCRTKDNYWPNDKFRERKP